MEFRPLPYKKIISVCTNVRAPGERICCGGHGGIEAHAALKQWVKDQGLRRHVRVCKSGCMDRCEYGPNALIMPDNIWVCGIDEAGLESLKAWLLEELGPEAAESSSANDSESMD